MKRTLFKPAVPLLFGFVLANLGACVSVDLKPAAATKSQIYQFANPVGAFEKLESEQVDHVWQNAKNGNTLAVLTECSEARDLTLTAIENETISALTDPQVVRTESIRFADRGGLRTLVKGQVDGVPVQMEILTLKKNSCSYTLSYMGKALSFEEDQKTFDRFVKGFVIP